MIAKVEFDLLHQRILDVHLEEPVMTRQQSVGAKKSQSLGGLGVAYWRRLRDRYPGRPQRGGVPRR